MSALVETMFYVGEEPWHGIGTKLESPPTSQEAMVAAGLDWDVEARPVYDHAFCADEISVGDMTIQGGHFDEDTLVVVPNIQAVRRITDGKFLGAVGPAWKPLQNREAFGWFDSFVKEGLAKYHTAGSLRDGKTVWILCQIGNDAPVVGDDQVGQFLLLNMGHDGLRGINILPTTIRVVCANTLSWAESKGRASMARFIHSGDITGRMDDFGDVIKLFLQDFDATNEVFRLMAGTEVLSKNTDAYLDAVFPRLTDEDGKAKELSAQAVKLRENILAKFEGDLMGYDLLPSGRKNTLWTIYNAVTEFIDHERGKDECRLESGWFGDGAVIKRRALVAAQNMI